MIVPIRDESLSIVLKEEVSIPAYTPELYYESLSIVLKEALGLINKRMLGLGCT